MGKYFGKVCVKHPALKGARAEFDRKCLGCVSERKRIWYRANQQHVVRKSAAWAVANPGPARKSKRLWKIRNKDRVHAEKMVSNRLRRANKRNARAPLTAIERARYQELYDIASALKAQTGVEHHVDHDVPLARGGLDHPDNMMVIPASINLAKGARYDSTAAFLFS